ncbi:CRISPR-associated endonuclease Cas2 [Enterococcus casseliflavus]|uniref:CRISPR-associated endoribonuclease Cas2 n=1 Tax=Enterococcus casseliflavus TaxID=37734 RepID=A0A415EP26_ENTCA|nr:CRISPR-associated endonuclease Cas2 [Enterococcus casseliflavus]
MMILITYDVATSTQGGSKRLRKVAKKCQDYGQRVQHSVFECVVDATQFVQLKKELVDLIDQEVDSLRIYKMGNNYKHKVEHIGAKESLSIEDALIF